MNRADLKEKISEISNSEFPLIDFFNDIGWLEGSKWFNTEKAYEDIEKIYNVFVYYTNKNKHLEKENQELKEDYLVAEKYASKYKSLINGKLWRDGKTRTKWFNKIRSQKDWIDYLSHLEECQSSDDEQLLRIVNCLDTQVLYWALLSLEKEIKRYSEEKFEDE